MFFYALSTQLKCYVMSLSCLKSTSHEALAPVTSISTAMCKGLMIKKIPEGEEY